MIHSLKTFLRESGKAAARRVRSRPDTEFQQAFIRIIIGLAFAFYFTDKDVLTGYPQHSAWVVLLMWAFVGWSVVLTLFAFVSREISPVRRYLGMLSDTLITTYLMAVTGEAGAALVFVYLWVTLGNGFRYGIRYLVACGGLSVTGFAFVIATSPFWQTHTGIATGLMIMLVLIPGYTLFLLKQLYRAIEQAKAANAAKSAFLANMSHELRTPLNGVIGIADLLRETPLNKEQQELTQVIHASALALHRLIENVLDISRIEAGKLTCVNEDYDLHYLINSLVMMLEPQAHRKGLVMAAHIAPRTPFFLHGDVQHLRQVLINLVGNAIKFTEHGRVDVYVRPFAELGRTWLHFEVTDSGIGIPSEMQRRIFESFTQADASITRRYGGTGLGTSISKQLVEMMGGRIGLNSLPGEGTTFWFEFPVEEQEQHPLRDLLPDRLRVGMLASPELSRRLGDLIGNWDGEAVALNANANSIVGMITGSEVAPDALIVERNLLGTDPAQFVRLLHDSPGFGHFPVILIDADAAGHQDDVWVKAGYSAVLQLPVNPTLLFNVLHEAASHKNLPENVVSLAEHFQARAGRARLRILVAEDNPVNQRVMRGLLEHAGHEVVMANDGEEALDLLEANAGRLSLAIMDMHMPGLSGPETVKRWRFMEKGHLPVIMLTADARNEAERHCREAGADDFLTKPVNSRALLDKVAQLALPDKDEAARAAGGKPHRPACVIDDSILKELAEFGGGLDFVRELVNEFRQDSNRALQATRQALVDRNYGAWREQMHMLKGGASDVGAQAMAEACDEAERIKPFEITLPLASERLDMVSAAQQQALSAMEEFLARQQSALGL